MLQNFLQLFKKPAQRIYLDHAAATPVHEEVLTAMAPYFSVHYGNPSAIHMEGVRAREAVEAARQQVARVLHVRAEQVLFTANGTESNNIALWGTVRALCEQKGIEYKDIEVVSTAIEHPSIARTLDDLALRGVAVRYVDVDGDGRIDEHHLGSLLSKKTQLVTFAYANSEIGVVQDVKRLTRCIKKFNTQYGTSIRVHLDASQAPLWLSCNADMLGVDLMTLDAGKCYGPKGVGVLAYRQGAVLQRVIGGGEQEFGLRAGTENTPLIVGCAASIERAQRTWKERAERVVVLRDQMIEALLSQIDGSVLNGPHTERIANNVNISILGIDSEFAIVTLDQQGIAASTQSACSGGRGSGSAVVRALCKDEARALSTLRFTLGDSTTQAELMAAVDRLKIHVHKMRSTIANTDARVD